MTTTERCPVDLRALAISAKRYVLYERRGDEIVIRKASWHGFGLYRNPLPKRGPGQPAWEHPWPEWVDVVWRRFIAEAEGLPVGAEPDWFALPAVGQLPVSSPAVLRPFAALNADEPYERQVKRPRADEIRACADWLDAQLALVDPIVILALGRTATRRLLASTARLEDVQGRAHRAGDRWVVPAFHPSPVGLNRVAGRREALRAAVLLTARMVAAKA